MKKLKIVFMGTPGFASGILDCIVRSGHEVVAVVTVADKPAGRGQKLAVSAVKEYAVAAGIPVLQPVKLKDADFLEELASFQADVFVIVAFRMLPQEVWMMPPLGTFNLHASLLPQYRGAAPINWALINGDSVTGVTTFFIDDKIDTGAILLKEELAVSDTENVGMLHDRLMDLGGRVTVKTLDGLAAGELQAVPQPEESHLKPAPKLNKENTRIDWSRSGTEIVNLIRGLSPYPVAWSLFQAAGQEWAVKIYQARFELTNSPGKPGSLLVSGKQLGVVVSDGIVYLEEMQLPGKKRMKVSDLLNGFSFPEHTVAS